jgi:hypothetical protein
LDKIVIGGHARDNRLWEILEKMNRVQEHSEKMNRFREHSDVIDMFKEHSTMKLFYQLVGLVLGHNWTLDVTGVFPNDQSMRTSIEEAIQLSTVINASLSLMIATQLLTGTSPVGVAAGIIKASTLAINQSTTFFSDAPIVFLWTALFVILDSESDRFDDESTTRLYHCLQFFVDYDAKRIWDKNKTDQDEEFERHKLNMKASLIECRPRYINEREEEITSKYHDTLKDDHAMKTLADVLGTLLLFCEMNDGSDPNADLSVKELLIIVSLLTVPKFHYEVQKKHFSENFKTVTMTVTNDSSDMSKPTTHASKLSDEAQEFLWNSVDNVEGAAINSTTIQTKHHLPGLTSLTNGQTLAVSRKTWFRLKFWENSVKTIKVDGESATGVYKVGIFGGRSGRMSRLGSANLLFGERYFKKIRIVGVTGRQALEFR